MADRLRLTVLIIVLFGSLCAVVPAQKPSGPPQPLDMGQLAGQVRQEAERQLPIWERIFEALELETEYDPEKIAGFCLRSGRSTLECQLNVVTGFVAFQMIVGDDVTDDGAEKLKVLLNKFAQCGRAGSCAQFEKELKSRVIGNVASSGAGVGEFDPEKVYSICLSQQDPKNPCTKQFCFNAAVMGGSFLLMFSTGNENPSTPEQRELKARTDRLVEKLNAFTRKVGQTAADKNCKDGLPPMALPPNENND